MKEETMTRSYGGVVSMVAVLVTTIATLLVVAGVYVLLPDLRPVHIAQAEKEEADRLAAYEEQKRLEAIAKAEREAEKAKLEAYLKTPEGMLSDGKITFEEIYVHAGEQYIGTVNEDAVPDYGSEFVLNPLKYRQVKDSGYKYSKYKFAFADNLYNKVRIVDDSKGFQQEWLHEYMNTVDGSALTAKYTMITSKETEKYLKLTCDKLLAGLTNVTEELYEVDAEDHFATALYYATDGDFQVTILAEVYYVNVSYLVLKYPKPMSAEDELHKNYYRDCVLNYCGFYKYGTGYAYLYDEYLKEQ